jgi:signal transduction histidine kinase
VERVVAPGVTAFHVGMETMLERVRAAGGEVDVRSAPEHGTRIGFWVPTQPAADRIPAPAA